MGGTCTALFFLIEYSQYNVFVRDAHLLSKCVSPSGLTALPPCPHRPVNYIFKETLLQTTKPLAPQATIQYMKRKANL